MNCLLCGRVAGFRRKVCLKCQAVSGRLVRSVAKDVGLNAKISVREDVLTEQLKESCGHIDGIINRDCKNCRAAYMRAWRRRGIRIGL